MRELTETSEWQGAGRYWWSGEAQGSRTLAVGYATSVPSAGRCSHSDAAVFPCCLLGGEKKGQVRLVIRACVRQVRESEAGELPLTPISSLRPSLSITMLDGPISCDAAVSSAELRLAGCRTMGRTSWQVSLLPGHSAALLRLPPQLPRSCLWAAKFRDLKSRLHVLLARSASCHSWA